LTVDNAAKLTPLHSHAKAGAGDNFG